MAKGKIIAGVILISFSGFVGWRLISNFAPRPAANGLSTVSQNGITRQFDESIDNISSSSSGQTSNSNADQTEEQQDKIDDSTSLDQRNLTEETIDGVLGNIFQGGQTSIGSIDPATLQRAAEGALQEETKSLSEDIFKYAVDSVRIRVLKNSQTSDSKKYLSDFQEALNVHNETLYLPRDSQNINLEALLSSEIAGKLIPYYSATIEELYRVAVPENFLSFHESYLEYLGKMQKLYLAIVNYKTDNILALFALQNLQGAGVEGELLQQKLSNFLRSYK